MTRLFHILFLFIPLISCTKEDDPIINGKVLNGDNEYNLNYAYLSCTDEDLGIYMLFLSSDKINFEDGKRIFRDNPKISIDIVLYKGNSNKDFSNYYPMYDKEPGPIDYDHPSLAGAITHFDLKRVGEAWETKESYYSWQDGSITIVEDNDNYKLDFSLIVDDRVITGYFNGKIQIVEF